MSESKAAAQAGPLRGGETEYHSSGNSEHERYSDAVFAATEKRLWTPAPFHPRFRGSTEPDRWQILADAAYALDGEPSQEAGYLLSAAAAFRGCDSATDWPGYAVSRLLEALLVNRRDERR